MVKKLRLLLAKRAWMEFFMDCNKKENIVLNYSDDRFLALVPSGGVGVGNMLSQQ